jgi:hypothetical protein
VRSGSVHNQQRCERESDQDTDVRVDCELNGEVDPWGVAGTEVWFEWGDTPALGQLTPAQPIATGETLVAVSALVEGVRPNESSFYYRRLGEDENVKVPEQLMGGSVSFKTPIVAPRVVGLPGALFVHSSSAVLFGELNPENAETEYFFEYGLCEELDDCG